MSEKVDLSLDDIIKMNKRGGQKGAGPKGNSQRLKHLANRSGLVRKGGPKQTNTRQNTQQQGNNQQRKELTLLHVSNLHYDVSNDDVRELFKEIGPIKKAAVHYDKSGRSLGTAEVIFLNRDAALRAIKKYHNLPLDGRPMSITLVPSGNQPQQQQQQQARTPAKNRIGVKPGSGVFKKSQQTNNRLSIGRTKTTTGTVRTKPKFQRQKKDVSMTAEQLDADLEAYTMKTS